MPAQPHIWAAQERFHSLSGQASIAAAFSGLPQFPASAEGFLPEFAATVSPLGFGGMCLLQRLPSLPPAMRHGGHEGSGRN